MESLSQIRHAKANRPVFSAEFLARVKRVIIFKPLDAEAMEGITKELCRDLIKKWAKDRGKVLIIDQDVEALIAERAHTQNEKSKGKEGGRIVRKMIANLVEAKLQSAISLAAGEYSSCKQVCIRVDSDNPTEILVSFETLQS